jgi:hypothetical protein
VTGFYGQDYDDDGNPIPDGLDLDGGQLLGELHAALSRYVILPSPEAADAVVLWIAASHGVQAWHCAPRLDVTSPVKRCGKSRLLDVIMATCHDPLLTVNISPAALVRSISDDPPTLLLDEADTVFGPKAADSHEDLRGIINAGHSRNRPYIRWDMQARKPEHCPTFAMAALAGIGSLRDAMHGETILNALHEISEAPWGDYFGKPMSARDMAKLLKPYGVSSVDVKVDGVNRKGYRRDHLHDSWTRYLPSVHGESATSATSATAQVSDGVPVAGSGQQALPATSALPLTSGVAQVAQLADTPSDLARTGVCSNCGKLMTKIHPRQVSHPECAPPLEPWPDPLGETAGR